MSLIRLAISIAASLVLTACASTPAPQGQQNAAGTTGKVFYVDATTGNDANDGQTEFSAWKSFENLRTRDFQPGDAILLKRGEVWFDTLFLRSSGSKEAKIRIGSYGTNPKPPIISGAISAGELDWKKESAGVWVATLEASEGEEPVKAYKGDSQYPSELLKERARRVREEGDWAFEGKRLFVRSRIKPSSWSEPFEFNVRRYAIDLSDRSHIELLDVMVIRSRDGVRVGGNHNIVKNVRASENSLNGLLISGSWNVIEATQTSENGVRLMPGKSTRSGQGILVEGTQNQFLSIESFDNEEDGIQFIKEAGSGNVVKDAKISGNGENCVDVKGGSQRIWGGELKSDGATSEDCVIIHKSPHTTRIESSKISATTNGSAISVFDAARMSVEDSTLQSEESPVVLFSDSAGSNSVLVDSKIGPGGSRARALIEVRAGKGHRVTGNTYSAAEGVAKIKRSPQAEILDSDE